MPFAVILQLVKAKAQQGQINAPQFVQITNSKEQQINKADTIKSQSPKPSVQIGETVKQIQINEKMSVQTADEKAVVQIKNDQSASEEPQQNNVLSQPTKQVENKKSTEQKPSKDTVPSSIVSADSDEVKVDKNKSEAFKKVNTQVPKASIQMENVHQQSQSEQITNKQAKLLEEEKIKTVQKSSTRQINKSIVNQSNEKNQSSDSTTQIVNQSKIKDNTLNKDQTDSKPISNRQSDSQRIQNNKGSEKFTKTFDQRTIAQKQSIDITPTQNKTPTVVDQKNIPLQSIQPKNSTLFTSQAKQQSNPPKVTTAQQVLDDQTKIADNKWDKTVQNEVSKGQISVRPKADSYQIDHDQIGTESPKTIFIAQQPKEPDTKSNKINSRSREMIALDHQESQRAVLSKNLVDYLESQAQLSPQNTSHDPQKVKDRSTQRASQQSGVITGNLVSNIVSEQTKSQPTAITFKQAQVIVRNMVLQIQDSTSEFTQFKQLKKEIPDQLKRSEPIKIETFKLEIAKELKRDSPQIIRQPQMERFEQTEQLKELLNSKLARRTYENEHTVHVHQQFQKDIDSVITRIEQQRASSNIQNLAETIKEMQNSTIEKATVELSPPTLGKVEIELIKQQDKLMITLKVATDEAKEILEKSSKDLISRLNTLGFKVEHLDVKTAQKTQEDQLQKDQEHDHQQQHKQKRNRQEEVNQDDQRD